MRVSEVFHGESLTAAELKDDVTLTIDGYKPQKFDDGTKIALSFKETDRTLILNKTNANTIAEMIKEDDLDRWDGVRIVIYKDTTDFQGKRVDCIRVKSAEIPATEGDRNQVPF